MSGMNPGRDKTIKREGRKTVLKNDTILFKKEELTDCNG